MAGPRILIIRTSALGDVVHSLPVLTALRRELPEARIGWVLEQAFEPVLARHPALDELILVRLRPWRRALTRGSTWRELAAFVRALDRFSAEIALDLMGNHKSAAIAALSMADRRIGLGRRWRREPSSALWLSSTVAPRGRHAVERALSALDGLGLPATEPDFGPDDLFPAAGGTAAKRELLLHPGAGWANKIYPAADWGEAARLIGEARGLETRVSAGPGERALAERVVAASGGWARLLGDESLADLAAAIRASALVLGGDTGPVHLAHGMDVPVLCVMGPTDPAVHGPYGAPGSALYHRLPCSFCERRLDSVKACLLEIPPAAVAERALALLDGPVPRGHGQRAQ